MNSMENKNEPAFAAMNEQEIIHGLTKREYFAGLAMQGLCSNNEWIKKLNISDDWDDYKERLASGAIEIADELLKKL